MERADLWELEAEGVKGSRSIAGDWVVQELEGCNVWWGLEKAGQ